MKVCSKCGISLPVERFSRGNGTLGLRYECKKCVQDYNLRTKDKRLLRQSAYNESHKEEVSVKRKARYVRDREKERAQQASYNVKHANESRARALKWAKDNPERARARNDRHTARKRGNVVGFIPEDPLSELVKIFGDKCIVPECNNVSDTVDHVVPLALGGHHAFYNMQPMCRSCNSRKGAWRSTDHRLDYQALICYTR